MSEDPEKVSISIDGKKFSEWSDVEITLNLDGNSTCAFTAPMEPEREEFRKTFEPFSFKSVEIETNDESLFSGTMLTPDPTTEKDGRFVVAQCYSKPGVLDDCTLPADMFPLEFNGLTLKQIATLCCEPFGIEVVTPLPLLVPDPPFARINCDPESKVSDFLSDLAKQRNLLISSTKEGKLEFLRPFPSGLPVVVLEEGKQPLASVKAEFNAQEYYSEVTSLGTKKLGGKNGRDTAKNPWLTSTRRPLNFKVDASEAASMGDATTAKLGRMFANMVSYSFELPTWRNPAGNLWNPGQFLTLKAPGAMVYKPTLLMMRTIVLSQRKDVRTARFNVVLPGSFSGEAPKVRPWE